MTRQQVIAGMTGEQALAQLGVSSDLITDEERRQLDENGFVILENVLDSEKLAFIRRRIDELIEEQSPDNRSEEQLRDVVARHIAVLEKALAGREANRDELLTEMSASKLDETLSQLRDRLDALREALASGDPGVLRAEMKRGFGVEGELFVENIFETDPVFHLPLEVPRVLAAVTHILGPEVHLTGMTCRFPQPGHGQQALHRTEGGPRRLGNTLWMIDDVTPDNGPTRMVPGTHLVAEGPGKDLEGDPTRTHPREVKIVGKAGSVMVFDDRIWHGGSLHNGGGPRRVLIAWFTRRSLYEGIPLHTPEATVAGMNPAQEWLLDRGEPESVAQPA